jgi:hypothetical membrane protein
LTAPIGTIGLGQYFCGARHMTVSDIQTEPLPPNPRVLARWSALAGMAGPIFFVLVFTLAGALSPRYSPLRQPISDLGATGPYRWIQNTNFVLSGLLLLAFIFGFFWQMRPVIPRAWLRLSTFCLILTGAGLTMVGFFPTDIPGFPPVSLHGLMHDILFFVIFGALLIALFVIGWRLRQNPAWHRDGWYATITGLGMIALFVVLAIMTQRQLGGLFQRIFEIEAFAWYVVMGWRLFRMA